MRVRLYREIQAVPFAGLLDDGKDMCVCAPANFIAKGNGRGDRLEDTRALKALSDDRSASLRPPNDP
jgi:hypothetical protein